MDIAILGATGHIAKGLVDGFCKATGNRLHLFTRSPGILDDFLSSIHCGADISMDDYDAFHWHECNVIINCVGIGDPGKLKESAATIFSITETFDNLVLEYLDAHPDALYINFSSGAAYGTDFSSPADEYARAAFQINNLEKNEYYGMAKACSEAKHRAAANLNIVDLRVFGYFSRFIDLKTSYLMTEAVNCIKDKKEFVTGPDDIMRDYVHPADLFALIGHCIKKHALNEVYDVYSLKPVGKFEMLDRFAREFGLKYTVTGGRNAVNATGIKSNYYSLNRRADGLGYKPQYTSLDGLVEETRAILKDKN